VIVVVEGKNDICFLKHVSRLLHGTNAALPNLAAWEEAGRLLFVPCGGALDNWADRLGPLGLPEFHLYDRDRELPPETQRRREAVTRINGRPDCYAALTSKRSLENYLHPAAISAAGGLRIEFGDFDPVGELVARRRYESLGGATAWQLLSRRARKRMTNRAKGWLNTEAVGRMTFDELSHQDPDAEIAGWLAAIANLASRRA